MVIYYFYSLKKNKIKPAAVSLATKRSSYFIVVGGVPIALILHPQNRCFKYYLVL
jgi:hypothetical protein